MPKIVYIKVQKRKNDQTLKNIGNLKNDQNIKNLRRPIYIS